MSEVFRNDKDIAEIGDDWIARLKRAAAESPLRRSRLCLHRNNEDHVQEMVIALCKDVLFRPHRHMKKSESFHIIEGELYVLIFDDNGRIIRTIHMGPPGSGRMFCYRLSMSAWHAILPQSEYVIFHETTDGPFRPLEASQFAPWAPVEPEALRKFLESSLQSSLDAKSTFGSRFQKR